MQQLIAASSWHYVFHPFVEALPAVIVSYQQRWRPLTEEARIMCFIKDSVTLVWLGCLLISRARPSAPNNVLWCHSISVDGKHPWRQCCGKVEEGRVICHSFRGLNFFLSDVQCQYCFHVHVPTWSVQLLRQHSKSLTFLDRIHVI